VETVKGYANFERETLQAVVEARARVGQVKVGANTMEDPKAFRQFQESQAALSSALSRLLVVVERYPDLKASQGFLTLQSQLEGTENRIAVARRRYIEAVKEYNKLVRYFPTNLTAKYLLHAKVKENFTVEDRGVEKAPKVKFEL
jgi:LemA protein